jgi:hypothetical protein
MKRDGKDENPVDDGDGDGTRVGSTYTGEGLGHCSSLGPYSDV